MVKVIYDILPPKYKEPARRFWLSHSGKIKIAALLVFLVALSAGIIGTYTTLVREEQVAPAQTAFSTLLLTALAVFAILKALTPPALTSVGAGLYYF